MPARQPPLGFYRLTVEERRQALREATTSVKSRGGLGLGGCPSEEAADHMIENVVGRFVLPVGLATNFIVDGGTSFPSSWKSPAWWQQPQHGTEMQVNRRFREQQRPTHHDRKSRCWTWWIWTPQRLP